MAKQLEALRWLEELAAQPPGAGDPIASWISPDLARHLQAAGLFTLRQLVTHINGIGKRWYCSIPAVGPLKAKRIEDWLRAHETEHRHGAGTPCRCRPEEALRPRAGARGAAPDRHRPDRQADCPAPNSTAREGKFRAAARAMHDARDRMTMKRFCCGLRPGRACRRSRSGPCRSSAASSLVRPEGPLDWLGYLSHTQRAYLKEAERFMLWAIVQHKKPLSSMTLEDCEAYRDFLADPTPQGQVVRAARPG